MVGVEPRVEVAHRRLRMAADLVESSLQPGDVRAAQRCAGPRGQRRRHGHVELVDRVVLRLLGSAEPAGHLSVERHRLLGDGPFDEADRQRLRLVVGDEQRVGQHLQGKRVPSAQQRGLSGRFDVPHVFPVDHGLEAQPVELLPEVVDDDARPPVRLQGRCRDLTRQVGDHPADQPRAHSHRVVTTTVTTPGRVARPARARGRSRGPRPR